MIEILINNFEDLDKIDRYINILNNNILYAIDYNRNNNCLELLDAQLINSSDGADSNYNGFIYKINLDKNPKNIIEELEIYGIKIKFINNIKNKIIQNKKDKLNIIEINKLYQILKQKNIN